MTTTANRPIILEVTLRDGGYQNNWDFTQDDAGTLVALVQDAGIDWVEIGYRNSPPKETNTGLTGRTPNSYIEYLRKLAPDAKLAVMYGPGLITNDDIDQMADLGVAMLRCSMPNTGDATSLPLIRYAYKKGLVATANMTHVTEYKMPDLIAECRQIWDNGCSVIYVADSNGSSTPSSVKAVFSELQAALPDVVFGFHNHNMLGMAMANVIAAMESGVAYIDASLRGMGRSAGNVPTESLLTWFALEAKTPMPAPSVVASIRAANYLDARFPATATPRPTLQDLAGGAYDFDSLLVPLITQAALEYDIPWLTLIAAMAKAKLDKPNITIDIIRGVARAVAARQL
ncbi:hypothetical protein WMF38_51665 [Sorangium sp. So ce118]